VSKKILDDFKKSEKRMFGVFSWCKSCDSDYSKIYRIAKYGNKNEKKKKDPPREDRRIPRKNTREIEKLPQ
jgi:hypothetical protein